jgi:hypothetical protein
VKVLACVCYGRRTAVYAPTVPKLPLYVKVREFASCLTQPSKLPHDLRRCDSFTSLL